MNKGSGDLRTANNIERELDNLAHLRLPALRMEWRRRYRSNPPKTKSTMMLRRLLAWRIQEEVFGGLSMFSKQRVVALSTAVDRKLTGLPYIDVKIAPGTKMVAEWNGERHSIEVLEIGFVWRSSRFATLDDVAFAITGMHRAGGSLFSIDRPDQLSGR